MCFAKLVPSPSLFAKQGGALPSSAARAFSATGPAAEDELCCNMRLFRATRATAFNGEARSPLTFHLKKAEVSSHTIDFTPFASLRQSAADQRKKLFIRSKIFWFFTDSARWKSGNSASFSTKRFSSAFKRQLYQCPFSKILLVYAMVSVFGG